jgi:hypothetical protein
MGTDASVAIQLAAVTVSMAGVFDNAVHKLMHHMGMGAMMPTSLLKR